MKKLVAAVLALGLAAAGCSTSQPSPEARAFTQTCNVFKLHHYGNQQVEMVAASGQRSGDALIAREAARLQTELQNPNSGSAALLIDLVTIAERCAQRGAISKADLDRQFAKPKPPTTR